MQKFKKQQCSLEFIGGKQFSQLRSIAKVEGSKLSSEDFFYASTWSTTHRLVGLSGSWMTKCWAELQSELIRGGHHVPIHFGHILMIVWLLFATHSLGAVLQFIAIAVNQVVFLPSVSRSICRLQSLKLNLVLMTHCRRNVEHGAQTLTVYLCQ